MNVFIGLNLNGWKDNYNNVFWELSSWKPRGAVLVYLLQFIFLSVSKAGPYRWRGRVQGSSWLRWIPSLRLFHGNFRKRIKDTIPICARACKSTTYLNVFASRILNASGEKRCTGQDDWLRGMLHVLSVVWSEYVYMFADLCTASQLSPPMPASAWWRLCLLPWNSVTCSSWFPSIYRAWLCRCSVNIC